MAAAAALVNLEYRAWPHVGARQRPDAPAFANVTRAAEVPPRGLALGCRFETLIRPGTPADAEAVARVHVRSWQAAYAHVFPAERLAELSVERRAHQWREWPPLVAEANGVIVGFVSVGASRDDDAAGELFAIYVDPEHWGTGVGRELIAAGEERLRELGHANAILWVLDDNPRARRFYERAGWHPDGTTRPIDIFGIEVPEVRYRKDLQIQM